MRKWQVIACDGDKCAALLLSFFEYWHNVKLEQRKQAIVSNDVAERHGDKRTQTETLYQFHTEKELEDGLLGLYKRTRIRSALELLVDKGFISIHANPNPKYAFDKTRHFLFHADRVNTWLQKVYLPSLENNSRSTENGSPSLENGGTIPEITTETTTEKKDIYTVIFNHWNSQHIKVHRKLTEKMKTKIRSVLKDYSQEEVCDAISTYAMILHGKEYFFNYVWSLDEFLGRGISKFDNRKVAINNFRKDKPRQQQEQDVYSPAHRPFIPDGD